MRQFKRTDRLSSQVLRDVSRVVDSDFADKIPGLVTFTRVKLSKDLRYATIYYSCLGEEEDRRLVAEGLSRNKSGIRRQVGQGLHVRRIPEFTFKFDPSVAEGVRIEELLNEIKRDSEN